MQDPAFRLGCKKSLEYLVECNGLIFINQSVKKGFKYASNVRFLCAIRYSLPLKNSLVEINPKLNSKPYDYLY